MHRSGTSLVAQLVAEWGAFMGDDLMPRDENNPTGYWEFNPLVALHDKMLNESGATWSAPSMEISTDTLIEKYGDEALGLVEIMDQHGNTWCWKDPRTALFLDFWMTILRNRKLIFIITHRNLEKIASSLFARDKMPGSLSVGLWEYYTLRIFEKLAGQTNYCFVNYDQFVNNPDQEGVNLFRFLDQTVRATEDIWDVSWRRIIDKNLDRSQSLIKIIPTPLQQELLAIYSSKVIPLSFSPSAEAKARLRNLFSLALDPARNSQHLYFVQLFFQNDDELFTESNSITWINPGLKQRFSFDLTWATDLKILRFDPLNDFVHVILHEITFLKDHQKLAVPVSITSNAFQQRGHEFLFDTKDAQIFIQMETTEFPRPDTLIIEAEYPERGESAVNSVKAIIMTQHARQLSEQNAARRELKDYISKQNIAIKELDNKLNEACQTIERMEKGQEELNKLILDFRKTLSYRLALLVTSLKRWRNILSSFSRFREEVEILKEIKRIKKSGLFDEDQYLINNPDIVLSRLTAVRHFVLYGRDENRAGGFKSGTFNGKDRHLHFHHNILGNLKRAMGRFSEKPEIILIRQSKYFNSEYYLRLNPDVGASGMEPEAHFFHFGWKEGRNPGPEFDTVFYLETYEDVKKQGVNPLIHFLQNGVNEKRLPKPFEYDENECIDNADLTGIEYDENQKAPEKIALICHMFHQDLADEFIDYFRQVPYPFDLFITASEKNLQFLRDTFRQELPDVQTTILELPNCGRDVAPFLHVLEKYLKNYELACKVHTKKSGHDKNLEDWRRYLLDQLLGNPSVVHRITGAFLENEKLGLVWPLPHPYLKHLDIDLGWGPDLSRERNFQAARHFFHDLELPALDEKFKFPAGNMFWFRPKALEYLAKKGFSCEDFGEEAAQIDGTLAHAIERITGSIAENSGYSTATVFFPADAIENDRDSAIHFPEVSRTILFIAHDLFRAGAEMVLLHILNWLKKHTAYNLCVLALKKGNDGGKLLPAYRRAAKVIMLDEIVAKQPGVNLVSLIRQEVGNPDLIYGNTILAATAYPLMKEFRVPVITHVHEMEESIRRYTTPEIRDNLRRITSAFIPCSTPVRTNLEVNHGVAPSLLHEIEEFIRIDSQPLPDRDLQRHKTGMPLDKVIIWGCGTIYWRKGTDLFIETAGFLKNMGIEEFLFCWIGSNHWNNDRHEWGEWQKQEKRIRELSLQEMVVFLGEKERPRDYFKTGDIYYLPSREDPYPLVCLEAAECELPVICFDGAGGMPGFVEDDAGAVVPFADSYQAAEAIAKLIAQPELRRTQGKAARAKLLHRHTDNIAVPRILDLCRRVMQTPPAISVVVPVYNHAPYLRERLDSILNQKFRDIEIIILDDASTDESAAIAADYLWHPSVRLIRNRNNTGTPFRQWQKGIEEASGTLVWIAEGDDSAEPDLLTTLIPAFQDENISMAWCGSHCLDENGMVSRNHYLRTGHYDGLAFPRERWLSDYVAEGMEEIINALSVRNTIPNVSAVLFRRTAFESVDFSETDLFRTAGDWRIYVSILKNGKLAYFHRPLNYHRIRGRSVVGSNKSVAAHTLPDYFRIHRNLVEEFDLPASVKKLMINSVTMNLRQLWPELSDEEFGKLYDVSIIKA